MLREAAAGVARGEEVGVFLGGGGGGGGGGRGAGVGGEEDGALEFLGGEEGVAGRELGAAEGGAEAVWGAVSMLEGGTGGRGAYVFSSVSSCLTPSRSRCFLCSASLPGRPPARRSVISSRSSSSSSSSSRRIWLISAASSVATLGGCWSSASSAAVGEGSGTEPGWNLRSARRSMRVLSWAVVSWSAARRSWRDSKDDDILSRW